MLAGISSRNGFSNNGMELEVGYQLLDGLIIEADRQILNEDIQMWFDFNKTGVEVEIEKFKPFKEVQQSQPQFTISQNG
jgi:hypothetical protein